MATTTPITYVIIDSHTRKQIGKPYVNANRARSRADKLDMEYGACRYRAVPSDLLKPAN